MTSSPATFDFNPMMLNKARERLERILQASKNTQKINSCEQEEPQIIDVKAILPTDPQEEFGNSTQSDSLPDLTTPAHSDTPGKVSQDADRLTNSATKKGKKLWSLNGFRCQYCPRIFNYASERTHHQMVHTRPFKCSMCSKGWPSNFALRLHMERIHKRRNGFDISTQDTQSSSILLHSISSVPGDEIDKVYRCSECPFTTKGSSAIYKHRRHHGATQEHQCQLCTCSYTTLGGLGRHVGRVHPQLKPKLTGSLGGTSDHSYSYRLTSTTGGILECSVCFQTVQPDRMVAHRRLYHPELKPYSCSQCPYATGSGSSIHYHRKSHEMPNEFNCLYCSASYSTLLRVNFHIRKTHPDCPLLPPSNKPPEITKPNVEAVKGEVQYCCCLCSRTYNWESDLRRHMGSHIMAFRCSECLRRFPDKYTLRHHLKKGHGESRKSRISKRRQMILNRKKPQGQQAVEMSCPVCDTKLAGKTKLGLHLQLYHPNFEAYQCTECPFKTANQNSYYAHTPIHHRNEIFKCVCCSASFQNLRTREQHMQTLHPATANEHLEPEKVLSPRKASVHPAGYYKVIETSAHLGKDVDFTLAQEVACRVCGDVSPTRSGFELHFANCHGNDKPYVCEECPFKCVNYSTLTAHEKLHLEKNEFKCDYCSASFVNTIRRKNHLNSVHKAHLATGTHLPSLTGINQSLPAKNFPGTPNSMEARNPGQDSEPQVMYECGECHKAFVFSIALKIHQRKFHPSV